MRFSGRRPPCRPLYKESGAYDAANKTYTFLGDTNPLREVLRVRDDDHFSYEYFETHDGKESLAIRLEYTRMK
ncbi:MAG: hypothetical protein ABI821_17620 [Pseudomonadota bacterium]